MKLMVQLALLCAIAGALIPPGLQSPKEKRLVFAGTVLAVGPSPGYGSGSVQAYQLVRYRIDNVCEGNYEGKEIVVDHLLLDPNELKDLKVGEVACVGVNKTKDMSSRWNDQVLRHESDKIDAYYVVLDTFIRNCRCERPK